MSYSWSPLCEQPTFISSRKYYLHHAGPNYAVLDFSHEAFHELHVQGVAGRVHVQTGAELAALVVQLTRFLGRQPPLPEWVHSGAILGIQGGTKMVCGSRRCVRACVRVRGRQYLQRGTLHCQCGCTNERERQH